MNYYFDNRLLPARFYSADFLIFYSIVLSNGRQQQSGDSEPPRGENKLDRATARENQDFSNPINDEGS